MIAKILIRAPEKLKTKLQDTAKQQGHTLNALILQILWDWAERQGKLSANRQIDEEFGEKSYINTKGKRKV